jgi:hypothetical protein
MFEAKINFTILAIEYQTYLYFIFINHSTLYFQNIFYTKYISISRFSKFNTVKQRSVHVSPTF